MFKVPPETKEKEGVKEGHTALRLSPAFLKYLDDPIDHFGLFRKMVSITNDSGKIIKKESDGDIGPLIVFRRAGKGDKVDMRTVHPKTAEPIDLVEVWRPGDGNETF